jgi:hypothetical protein
MSQFMTPEIIAVTVGLLALVVFGLLIVCFGLQESDPTLTVDTLDTAFLAPAEHQPVALARPSVLV